MCHDVIDREGVCVFDFFKKSVFATGIDAKFV